jgi:hypothetical protein
LNNIKMLSDKGKKRKWQKEKRQITSGFTQAGVYARSNICANLQVHRPPEHLWNPRLREAATTLHASDGLHVPTETVDRKSRWKVKCNSTDLQ